MRSLSKSFWVLGLVLQLAMVISAGTPGSFRGTIVDGPHSATGKKWIYVQGHNGMARRVDISRASVSYGEGVPAGNRLPRPEDALTAGAEVRVTAEQAAMANGKPPGSRF